LLGFLSPDIKDNDYPALKVLSNLTGGGMSSRLFQEIRENRGLAYSVYSYLPTYIDTGLVVVYAGTNEGSLQEVIELVFPMTRNKTELARQWQKAADSIWEHLQNGDDCAFVNLGDPLLYSTYIYLLRALRKRLPDLKAVTVPGITAFGAAAALAEFPVGEGRTPVTIVPAADDLSAVRRALAQGGTAVLMKIGKRLPEILDLLDAEGLLEKSVFVSRATMAEQRIETDLRRLKAEGPEAGYLSIVLVHAEKGE